MQNKTRWLPIIISGLLLALCAECLLTWWTIRCGYEDTGRSLPFQVVQMQDCDFSDGFCHSNGEGAPQLSFLTDQAMGSVRLHFSAPLPTDTQVVLYYAPDTGTSFDPLRRAERYMMEGTDEGVITLPPGSWRYARLDIGNSFSVEIEPVEMLPALSVSVFRIVSRMKLQRLFILALISVTGFHALAQRHKKKRACKGQERIVFYDAVRVLAAFLVITLHVTSSLQAMDPDGMGRRLLAIAVKNFSMTCNCLFFLISGALLLPYRNESAGTFFRKRFLKAALPLLVYSLFYVRLLCISQIENGRLISYWLKMLASRQIPLAPHLRLVYEIIGAYLLVIPFRFMLKEMPEKTQKGLFLLVLAMLGLRTAALFAGLPMGISVFLNEWPGVLLLGYFLTRDWMRRYDGLLAGLGGAAFAASMWVAAAWTGYEDLIANHSLFMVLMASAIFVICLRRERFFHPFGKLLAVLGRYSYSVILLHWYMLYGVLFNSSLSLMMSSISLWIIQMVLCTVFSFAAAFVADNILLAALESVPDIIMNKMPRHP